jgi:large subunit ribosomal protein L2
MAIKKYKPTSPGRRGMAIVRHPGLHEDGPYKPLTVGKKRVDARNNKGHKTVRFRGGGHKRRYRIIDFKRDKDGVPGVIERLERDPNRTALIALIKYADGDRRYVIMPHGAKVGDPINCGADAEPERGVSMMLKDLPVGSEIFNIEIKPGQGGKMVRSAGTSARLMAHEGKWALVKLPSGEVRRFHLECRATMGQVSNPQHFLENWGKAGRSRWMGRRPVQRGSAMNPVDHPHGGGEGKAPAGMQPVSKWGWLTKGKKQRKKTKYSDRVIVSRRGKRR